MRSISAHELPLRRAHVLALLAALERAPRHVRVRYVRDRPRLAQRRVILFFWPMRAWSPNQISMLAVSVPSRRATAARRAEKFF